MPVGLAPPGELLPIQGIRLATAAAGLRYKDRDDVALIEIAPDSTTAAVFTRNAFCAAPVTVAKRHLSRAEPRWLMVNSGNANAGTGEPGISDARASCEAVAEVTGCGVEEVLPFSTGVIGQRLPIDKLVKTLPE